MTGDDRRDDRAARDVEQARANVRHAEPRYGRPPARGSRSSGTDWLQDFVRRYGWRAYALPILALVTVAALMTSTSSSDPSTPAAGAPPAGAAASVPPTADARMSLGKSDNQGALSDTVLRAAALPAGAAYTKVGKGTFRVLPGTGGKVGNGKLYRYSIDVENGITGVDLTQFATMVDRTMDDPRSWSGHGVSVQRVDSGRIDFHVSLTSTMTVRSICGFDIPVETSCYSAPQDRVVFNVARWMRGAPAYLGDLQAYRVYMINHENGHALGHNHAHQCLPGGLAPVMMQQTFGLRSTTTGALCGANPWPYPPGVKGTPGAEQLDTAQNNEYGRGD